MLFGGQAPEGKDYLLCYDYRELSFDEDNLKGYESIEVVAWSFGVWVASQIIPQIKDNHNFTLLTAINGTMTTVHDTMGIPTQIFEGTLSGFSPQNLSKFRHRMCGGTSGVKEFLELAPRREPEELREELEALKISESRPGNMHWDRVIISLEDKIIPTQNQQNAWAEHDYVIEIEAPHFAKVIFEKYLYE